MMALYLLVALAGAAPLSADQAVAAALIRSPERAEAEAEVTRAEGALRAATGLPGDPRLSASVAAVGEAWSLSVAQPLSLTGEGLAERTAAQRTADAAAARLTRAGLVVAADTRRAWIDAVVSRQRAALADEALAVATRIEAAAAQRAAAGDASQLDLLMARLQAEEARTHWMIAVVEEGRSAADLAARVGVDLAELELPRDPLAGAPSPSGDHAAPRSDVEAAAATVEAAHAALARERAGTLPPLQVGAFVEQEGSELRAGPTLSITVPIWRGNADGRAAARADLSLVEAQRDDATRRAGTERDAAARINEKLEVALADQGSEIPAAARAALDSVALGYDRGELDLLSAALLQAQILEGYVAWVEGRGLVAGARLDWMLAVEDARLLGEP